MSKYYRIRATSMATYYSYIDSEQFPHIFDKEGNPKEYQMYMDGSIEKIQCSDFDLFDMTWDYGVEPVNEDWEFTDYEVISIDEYVNAVTKEEKLLVKDTPEIREQLANDMVECVSTEDLLENYKYYLNKDWDADPSMLQQDYSNYSNTEQE